MKYMKNVFRHMAMTLLPVLLTFLCFSVPAWADTATHKLVKTSGGDYALNVQGKLRYDNTDESTYKAFTFYPISGISNYTVVMADPGSGKTYDVYFGTAEGSEVFNVTVTGGGGNIRKSVTLVSNRLYYACIEHASVRNTPYNFLISSDDSADISGYTGALGDAEFISTDYTVKVGETIECEGSSRIRGSFLDKAFKAESSDTSVADIIAIARTGNIIYADTAEYYYTLWIKGVGPGTATITLYDDSKKITIDKITVAVTGNGTTGNSGNGTTGGNSGLTSGTGKTGNTGTAGKSGQSSSGSATLSGSYSVGALSYTVKNGKATVKGAKKKAITKITIPSTISIKGKKISVTAIAPNAFKGMKKLKSVVIGKNIASIGKNAFYGCKKLTKITIKTTKLTKQRVGSNAFKGIYKKAVISSHRSKRTSYKKIFLQKGMKKTMRFR